MDELNSLCVCEEKRRQRWRRFNNQICNGPKGTFPCAQLKSFWPVKVSTCPAVSFLFVIWPHFPYCLAQTRSKIFTSGLKTKAASGDHVTCVSFQFSSGVVQAEARLLCEGMSFINALESAVVQPLLILFHYLMNKLSKKCERDSCHIERHVRVAKQTDRRRKARKTKTKRTLFCEQRTEVCGSEVISALDFLWVAVLDGARSNKRCATNTQTRNDSSDRRKLRLDNKLLRYGARERWTRTQQCARQQRQLQQQQQ